MAAPQNGQHLVRQRLEHDAERAARHQVAAEHRSEQNDDATDLKHEAPELSARWKGARLPNHY